MLFRLCFVGNNGLEVVYWLEMQLYRQKWCWMLRLLKFDSCPGKHRKRKKLYSKWVMSAHSWSKTTCRQFRAFLQLFQCNKMEFLYKYVIMDETWIHPFTPESNWQWTEWTAAGESRSKWPDAKISRHGFGLHILGCARYFVQLLSWKRKNHQ